MGTSQKQKIRSWRMMHWSIKAEVAIKYTYGLTFIDFDRDIEGDDEVVVDITGTVTALLRERPCTLLCEAEGGVVTVAFVGVGGLSPWLKVGDKGGVDGADDIG